MNVHRLHSSTGHRAALYALAQGRSPRHVLSAGGDGWVVEWNADNPEQGQLLASVESRIFSLCTVPDRDLVLAGNMDGGLHWIDRRDPSRTRNIQHHHKGLFDIARRGASVFTAGGDGLLTRWDLDTIRTVESIQLSHQALRCIALDPVQQEIAVGSSDGCIYFLDAETLALKSTLQSAHSNSVFTVAYQPLPADESSSVRHLLSGGRDAMLRIWDLTPPDPRLFSEMAAHWFTINHLAFSPDEKWLATASRDKTIKIWEAATFELLKVVDTQRYGGHIHSVNRLLWLPDGTLVSCSDDRSLMWWRIEI